MNLDYTLNAGVVIFPGSNCDRDSFWVLEEVMGFNTQYIWHDSKSIPAGLDLIILPGGFSYGDYLRSGAIAKFSPIMENIIDFAEKGGLVLGICNGFQILLETGLLPGAMLHNDHVSFICDYTCIKADRLDTPFTRIMDNKKPLRIPIAHFEGNYFADEQTIKEIEDRGQVVFRYCDSDGNVTKDANPNGSINNIAGLSNRRGNVMGMMPHPERASEKILGSEDGLWIFRSLAAMYKL
ncbi:MAG: phosphoribosylformylglycinamidine synthase subunit PurQ [Candidatus Zixiibacteriota bacterium]